MGISSAVRLAAWMPAKRATSSGLPLGFAGRAARTAAESSTKAEAVAVRRVGCLLLTSTMAAWPDASKCERLPFGWALASLKFLLAENQKFGRSHRRDVSVGTRRMAHPLWPIRPLLREAECGR